MISQFVSSSRVELGADSAEPGACFRLCVFLTLCPSSTRTPSLSPPLKNILKILTRQLSLKALPDASRNRAEILHRLNVISRKCWELTCTRLRPYPNCLPQTDFMFGLLTSHTLCYLICCMTCLMFCFVCRVRSQGNYVVKCHGVWKPETACPWHWSTLVTSAFPKFLTKSYPLPRGLYGYIYWVSTIRKELCQRTMPDIIMNKTYSSPSNIEQEKLMFTS